MAEFRPTSAAERVRQMSGPNAAAMNEVVLGMTPVVGDIMSARDAYQAGHGALSEFHAGNYGRGALSAGEAMLGGLGALPLVPNLAGIIKAYHGSPHRFDKFSLDKIGTGEGAQAYGHGLYFAESPDVARLYQEKLAERPDVLVGGAKANFAPDSADAVVAAKLSTAMRSQDPKVAIDQIMSDLDLGMERAVETGDFDVWTSLQDQKSSLQRMADQGVGKESKGSFYEVTLAPDHEDLLDWDLPLYEQTDKVKAGLGKLGVNIDPKGQWTVEPTKKGDKWVLKNVWGESAGTYKDKAKAEEIAKQRTREHNTGSVELLYNNLGGSSVYSNLDKGEASRKLLEAGIPGIRYLDAGSRSAADGTRNIALFDDNLVTIDRVE